MTSLKSSPETEQEVLATLMHFSDCNHPRVQKAILNLSLECFSDYEHREIYALIRKCFENKVPFGFIDILDLIPREKPNLHDAYTAIATHYTQFHIGESNFEYHVEHLLALAKLRKELNLLDRMAREVKDCPSADEAQEIISKTLAEISRLSYQESKGGVSNLEMAEAFYEGKISLAKKIPTTCKALNKALNGGIMPKSLIIIAAGASVGKTGFSIYLMDCIARAQPDSQSLFFSIEMESDQIWMRHVGICAGKQFDQLTDEECLTAIAKTLRVPMKIYDTVGSPSAADIDFILTTARLQARDKPVSVIVVDYLGLVQNKGSFERNDLKQSDITGKLAQLAIELNCTVIALSQINRGAANRGVEDRCPWPHDAADSSGGHRSSSLWLGVDRPELYQDDPCYQNQFVVKCRKNRFGDTFEIIFAFNEGTFAEVERGRFRQPTRAPKSYEEALFSSHREDF